MLQQQTASQQIAELLFSVATKTLGKVSGRPTLVLTPSHVADDLASNWPLALFPQLSEDDKTRLSLRSPLDLAQLIATQLEETSEFSSLLQQVSAAAPGFLNFMLTTEALQKHIAQFADDRVELVPQSAADQRILVEYADPNPFKEFHIGHLFNITVGETISRLLEATGADVVHVCYQGDVGMHVAKSLWGMRQLFATEDMDLESLGKLPLTERIRFLGRSYAAGAAAYEDEPAAKVAMQDINLLAFLASQKRLEAEEGITPKVDYAKGKQFDPAVLAEITALYTTGRAWSLQYFDTIYERLGTKFSEHFFESQSAEYGYSIVTDHVADGIFTESKGAIVFLGEEEGLHNRVFINSLGLPTYESKDLGLPLLKQDRLGEYDRSIIVTANEIDEYFKVVLKALSKIYPKLAAKTKHLSHGVIRLPEGKMSSRTGNILTGTWLLDESQQRILHILSETQPDMADVEKKTLADKVAISAVKYALLKSNLGSNIAFSFEESLSFTGNSGPYLEYTYVRCNSILQKAAKVSENGSIAKHIDTLLSIKEHSDNELNSTERDVLLYLYSYSDVVESAAKEYAPHQLCTYLFGLAQRFSRFYEACPIISKTDTTFTPLQQRRLLLVAAVARVLRDGMTLLGMPVVEQM